MPNEEHHAFPPHPAPRPTPRNAPTTPPSVPLAPRTLRSHRNHPFAAPTPLPRSSWCAQPEGTVHNAEHHAFQPHPAPRPAPPTPRNAPTTPPGVSLAPRTPREHRNRPFAAPTPLPLPSWCAPRNTHMPNTEHHAFTPHPAPRPAPPTPSNAPPTQLSVPLAPGIPQGLSIRPFVAPTPL